MKYTKREIIIDLVVVNLLCACVYYFIPLVKKSFRKGQAINNVKPKDTASVKEKNKSLSREY